MIDMRLLTNTAYETGITPWLTGGSVVFVNFTGGNLIVQGSDDDGVADAYATFVTVPAGGMIEGNDLPLWIKVSTVANIYMLA